ncbi:MAG: dephospho-CoA kinase [Rhodospirillales bacterium]
MNVLGLTGSIGMGKTVTANMFRYFRVPVHDADAVVHELLGPGSAAVEAVLNAFPGVAATSGGTDRRALGKRVFGDDDALRSLEAILHPLVQAAERAFKDRCRRMGYRLVVLDIPLLFETGGDTRCDRTCVVTAPAFLQRRRVMMRAGMTDDRFRQILSRQMPDEEKRRRADFIVQSGLGRHHALQQVREIVKEMTA